MKKTIFKSTLLAFFLLAVSSLIAQQQYTPYDDAPGNIKSYKPTYNSQFPHWAKMLYEYPINFLEINKAYEQSEERQMKTPITRYFKNWRRYIQPSRQSPIPFEQPVDADDHPQNCLERGQGPGEELWRPETDGEEGAAGFVVENECQE